MWYLIGTIPDLYTLTYFYYEEMSFKNTHNDGGNRTTDAGVRATAIAHFGALVNVFNNISVMVGRFRGLN